MILRLRAQSGWQSWRDDIATFVNRELIESAVDAGVTVRRPVSGVAYRAFCDPSGGMNDAFTCGIAHAEGEAAILDCLVEIPAPFNPTTATDTIAKTLKRYGLSEVVGDRYGAGWVVGEFSKHGVRYTHAERDRSAIYADALPLFMSGRARLLDNLKLVGQFANLERRTASFGRDRIDHPKGGHDDLSNSAAGALVLLGSGALNTGFIDYYQWLAHGGGGGEKADPAQYVRMRSPRPEISDVAGMDGRKYRPDADGTFMIHPDDLKGFRLGGWTEVRNEEQFA